MLFAAVIASSFVVAVQSQAITDVVGAPFANPAECSDLDCTLQFTTVHYYGPSASFVTRGFGSLPGPTIRAKAGDTLLINLINTLEDVDNTGNMNSYRDPNTTNIHTVRADCTWNTIQH